MVGENWLKVAGTAMALGIGLYVIPLGMIANPEVIALGQTPAAAFLVFAKLAVGLSALSYGIISNKPNGLRALLIAVGLAVVFIG